MEETPKDSLTAEGQEVDAEAIARFENMLVELSRALKAVNFYPRGHPTLLASLEKAHSSVVNALTGMKQVGFLVSKDGFVYQSKPIATSNVNLPPLARELFLRQVRKIFFMPELTVNELENFLRVIAMEEELFRGDGKAENYLVDNGVEHIWFNEMKFRQGRAIPQREEAERTKASDVDERIGRLIHSLRTERDPRKFMVQCREAVLLIGRFLDEGDEEPGFEIFKVLRECFTSEPPRPPLIVESARSAFFESATPKMVEFLLRQITLLHGPRQDEVVAVALELGDVFIEAILDKLATNEALYSHRALLQILLQYPDLSRSKIEGRLNDARWYVVRKMAFLLGEIANPQSVSWLINAVEHEDMRVVKEVLKALVKIKTPDSTRFLVGLLDGKLSQELMLHLIRLLGNAKEVSSVPSLMKILKNRGALLENLELYQEVIRALGQIGSQQAVPLLKEVLLKRNLLAKSRALVLSVESAEALSKIGGKSAIEALEAGAKSKTPEIASACRKGLQALGGSPVQVGDSVVGMSSEQATKDHKKEEKGEG